MFLGRFLPLGLLLLLTFSSIGFAKEKESKQNDDGETNTVVEKEESAENGDENNNDAGAEGPKDLSNGFGTDIEWVPWAEAISIALDLNKPILLLIHKTWCGACQALKKSFVSHSKRNELVELSRQFVMVNVEDDDEPEEEMYAPDGRYIPRLFILDKEGKPLAVDNKKNYPSNQQYFPQVPDVMKAMKRGLELFGKEKTEKDKKKKKQKEQKEQAENGEKKEKEKEPLGPPEKISPNKKDKDDRYEVHPEGMMEDEMDAKAGGCPHAAGKAAKKAKEAAAEAEKKKEAAAKGKGGDEQKKKVANEKEAEKGKKAKKTDKQVEKEKVVAEQKQKKVKKGTDEGKEEL